VVIEFIAGELRQSNYNVDGNNVGEG